MITAIFGCYLLVHEAIVGVKKVVHGTQHAVHHVLHPHEKDAAK